MMKISVVMSSLPYPLEAAIPVVAKLGFGCVDLVALGERPEAHREALAQTELLVSCCAVGRGLPDGHALDAPSLDIRRAAIEIMSRQIADAANLGATACYLVPGLDRSAEAMARFREGCILLADFAARRMIKLCIEHSPCRALESVGATLAWLRETDHDNLAMLLDLGHCLITNENPAEAIYQSGSYLSYVHLDDNDGVGDLHWPLLTGRLSRALLRHTIAALAAVGYESAVALEYNAQVPEPEGSLARGRQLIQSLVEEIHG